MNRKQPRQLRSLCVVLVTLAYGCLNSGEQKKKKFFNQEIKPLFQKHCIECHGLEEREAGLNLSEFRKIISGGASGPPIVWGKPEESLLMEMIVGGEMPPKGNGLSSEEISTIKQWILLEIGPDSD
jgi:mono/diheme cytochrome c family protein